MSSNHPQKANAYFKIVGNISSEKTLNVTDYIVKIEFIAVFKTKNRFEHYIPNPKK